MSNVWATMPCVQLSHNVLVNCIDNRQNQLFSEMSLSDVMELPNLQNVSIGPTRNDFVNDIVNDRALDAI